VNGNMEFIKKTTVINDLMINLNTLSFR